jgi:hypothetical protein
MAEPTGDIPAETRLIEQRQTTKPPGVPISEIRLGASFKAQNKMGMLRMLGRGGVKQQESRHAQLCNKKSRLFATEKLDDDAFPLSVYRGNRRVVVPV